jgi:hypothetical protein
MGATWVDGRELTVEGMAFQDTLGPYDRLPARAEADVSAPVWMLSRHSAGVLVRFVTDSPTVSVRWTLRSDDKVLSLMAAAVWSGIDLYQRTDGRWRFLGAGMPDAFPDNEAQLIAGMEPVERELVVNLPLYNGVEALAIGVEEGAAIRPALVDPRQPLCMYGTSIVHGASASRPGMCHTAMLRRRLDWPTFNLGFAGNGTQEPAVAALLAELEPAAYVIDSLPNMAMHIPSIHERTEAFLTTLTTARPDVPILVVGATTRILQPDLKARFTEADALLREIVGRVQDVGAKALRYLPAHDLLGDDEDGTVDTVHPNDLGFSRMADGLEPEIRAALGA